MGVYGPREVSHLFFPQFSSQMPSESCLGTSLARVVTNFVKHAFFAKVGNVGKVWESDPLSSDPLSSDPLSRAPTIGEII